MAGVPFGNKGEFDTAGEPTGFQDALDMADATIGFLDALNVAGVPTDGRVYLTQLMHPQGKSWSLDRI